MVENDYFRKDYFLYSSHSEEIWKCETVYKASEDKEMSKEHKYSRLEIQDTFIVTVGTKEILVMTISSAAHSQ